VSDPAAAPAEVGPTRLVGVSPGNHLVFRPRVEQASVRTHRIVAEIDDGQTPWGFWGGVLSAAVGASVIAFEGLRGLWDPAYLLTAVAVMVVGLLLMRFGRRTSLDGYVCAEIDQVTRWLVLPGDGDGPLPVHLDEVTEVVFGMMKYPVSASPSAVEVDAYTVMVRRGTDVMLPVVEATPDKEWAYDVAGYLAEMTGLDVTQVGIGIK